ncbi:cell wall protein DAN4-like [Stylophora pistillata]|uniref:cell wall protein DAN4-like n=1 Tax=Stylophora pistillata TaxID=50429 RepID=UPI000C041E78|nr:cell wall protein DAN4-like [Stylophora pistillata]
MYLAEINPEFNSIKQKKLVWVTTITFLSLLYYTSLEIITSYARGHAMRTVATGLQSGVQLMNHFGGSRRKKIFIFLLSQASTSTSSLSTVSLPPTSGASSTPSASPTLVPPTSTATSTSSSSTVNLPPTSTATSTSPPSAVTLPPTSTATSTSPSSTVTLPSTSLSTAALTSTSSQATLLSPSSSSLVSTLPLAQPSTSTPLDLMPLPVDGASTRRYLTAMATASARGLTSGITARLSYFFYSLSALVF